MKSRNKEGGLVERRNKARRLQRERRTRIEGDEGASK